ncbi:hypothetical protein D3C85_872890 [compost metagenome]
MQRQGIDADHRNEALVDFQVIDLERLQVSQAGMAGAEVVDGNQYAQRTQVFEQLAGSGGGLDQFAFGQLQHQGDAARWKCAEELPAILEQGRVLAMVGGNVDTNMETVGKKRGMGGQLPGDLMQQRASHGHDQPAMFSRRDEQVRGHQPFAGVAPAHQHFDAGPVAIATLDHRLEIGNELLGIECPLQFQPGRNTALEHPAATEACEYAEKQQQAEHRRVQRRHQLPGLVLRVAGMDGESVARRCQLGGGNRESRQGQRMHATIGT